MSQVEIGAKISVDSGNAAKSINELQSELKLAKTAFNDAKIGSQEYTEAQKKVKEATEALNKTNGESSNAFGALKEKIFATVPGLKAAETGASSFGASLKALAANPIVLVLTAIVAALSFLYEAFTSTAAGAKQVAQVLDGLKAVMQLLYDRLMTFGTSIIKLFSGDFKGAINDAKSSVSGLTDSIGKAYDAAAKITKRLQELKKEQREDDVDRARREKDLALLREKLNDDSVPLKERLAAAKALRVEQIKNADDDLKRTTETSNLKIQRLKMERDGEKKNADEIAELQKNIFNTQKENALEGVRTNKVIRNLEKQGHADEAAEIAKLKVAQKELDEAKKLAAEEQKKTLDAGLKAVHDAEDKANENNRKYQFAKLKKYYDEQAALARKAGLSTLHIWQGFEEEKIKLEAKYKKEDLDNQKIIDDKKTANDKILFDRNIANITGMIAVNKGASDANLKVATEEQKAKEELAKLEVDGLNALAGLIGQNTAQGKAVAVAATTISTYHAAQNAYNSQMALATPDAPVRAAFAAGIAIVQGLARVKSILSVQVPGQGGGGSVPGGASPSAPVIPRAVQAQTSVLSQDSLNQINASASRAYVVESDVANNQQRISRINRAARLA